MSHSTPAAATAACNAFANPAPLGLAGFGMTTILLNLHNACPKTMALNAAIVAMGIFYGGLAQIIAGILEFRKNNTFGMVAFTSYGFFWLTLVAIWALPPIGEKMGIAAFAQPSGEFMAAFLGLWGVFTLFLTVGAWRGSWMLRVVFVLLTLLFAMLAIHKYLGNTETSELLGRIAGFEGIACGACALYLSFAEVTNEKYGRTVLPH